jgi:hypothetical protein
VTRPPKLKERDELPASNALYHFPASLSAYGDVAGYDLGNPAGLLVYVVDFVNRPQPKVTHEKIQSGMQLPRGREKLRQLLRAAVQEDSDLASPSVDVIRDRTGGIHWEHTLEVVPGGAEWRHHAHILSADAFYNLIASLLMSKENREALAQCRHEPCGKFFVVEKPAKGRPQSVYHDEKCRRAANDAGAAARQRASRTLKLALKLLGWASKDKAIAALKLARKDYPDATPEQLVSYVRRARKHK